MGSGDPSARDLETQARGIYRDPVRSSRGHFVKASGLRWLSVMLLTPIPWARRVWALPVLTALCPSERYSNSTTCRKRHKNLTDWARQMILQIRRWLPRRKLVVVGDSVVGDSVVGDSVVGDSSFSVIDLLAHPPTASGASGCACDRLRRDARRFA